MRRSSPVKIAEWKKRVRPSGVKDGLCARSAPSQKPERAGAVAPEAPRTTRSVGGPPSAGKTEMTSVVR